jgi:glycerol-3-phosphate acyltransferase PlsY
VSIEFVLLLLGAYLLGSVPAAYLAARWSRRIDIRQYGSGNIGVANLWRSTSILLAMPVIIFDFGKGMPLVWIAQLLGLGIDQQVAIGLAAIIGHNWPVFLRFSGGRGLLTTLGVAFILPSINGMVPWEAITALVIAAIGAFIVHNAPIGTGAAAASTPLISWASDKPLPMTMGFLAMLLIAVIRRLIAPKTSVTPSVPLRQLLLNRLLFDRDIRDSKAWLQRRPPQSEEDKGARPVK